MGFNFAGIAINKNYKGKITELQEDLGLTFTPKEEISYETASSNWKEDELCDIYFSENGTLLFLSHTHCLSPWKIAEQKVFTFAYSATSMAFNFVYCDGGNVTRNILEVEGNRMTDTGKKLSIEDKETEVSELIFAQIGATINESFWKIEPTASALRCHL